MFKKVLIGYGVAVVASFVLAAIVRNTFGLAAGQQVWDAAVCILILPFQLVAAIFARFSATPGAIDQYAINNVATWALLIAVAYFGFKFVVKKFNQALGGLRGGGGGGHH